MDEELDKIQGKYFSIVDPKDINTVIYQINRTEKEFLKKSLGYFFIWKRKGCSKHGIFRL